MAVSCHHRRPLPLLLLRVLLMVLVVVLVFVEGFVAAAQLQKLGGEAALLPLVGSGRPSPG